MALTLQLLIVPVVHKLAGVGLAAEVAVLVDVLHVTVQVVVVVEALAAKAAQRVALEPRLCQGAAVIALTQVAVQV